METFEMVNQSLYSQYPDNPFVRELNYSVTAEKYIKIGKEAPEISLSDTNGQLVRLSSLRGNYVLVDFWASWCDPCRQENPNVVRAYNKYNSSGFEVFSVSLDTNQERWLEAIKKDSLTWTHVSDLKKWDSKAAMKYAVRAIPYSLLIDGDGIIIAKKLRGSDLHDKLAEIFGF
jgi:peroxiredoxin